MATYVGKITLSGGKQMPIGSSLFGICHTESEVSAKYVELEDFDEIVDGITVHVLFDHSNKATSPYLNINGTGAFPILPYSAERSIESSDSVWHDGSIIAFTYYESSWIMNDFSGLSNEPGGFVKLNEHGQIDSLYLPAFVDDVLEFQTIDEFPASGETGKIYVALDSNLTYRWSGSSYVEISKSLALGETDQTAYRGDRGKTAFQHATDGDRLAASTPIGFYKLSITNEGHIGNVEAVSKADIEDLGIETTDTKYGLTVSGRTIRLVENGSMAAVTIPDTDTKYGLSIEGRTVSLVEGGSVKSVRIPDTVISVVSKTAAGLTPKLPNDSDNDKFLRQDGTWAIPEGSHEESKTYGLSINDHTVSLVENGGSSSVTIPDNNDNTTYGLSINGNTVSLVEGGNVKSVIVPDTDTKYGLSIAGNTVSIVEGGLSNTIDLPEHSDTKYGLSINGHTVSLVEGGTTKSVTVPDENDNTTYGLSINGNTVNLVENGTTKSITIPDTDTKYGLSINGNTVNLVENGTTKSITIPDTDTKYGLSISGNTVTLVEGGNVKSITVPDNDTTYGLSINGNTVSLVEGGSVSSVTVPDTDTTYGLSLSGRVLSLVEGGTQQSISLPSDGGGGGSLTYGLSISGRTVSLVEGGVTSQITLPADSDTTYSATKETINSVSIDGSEEISGISKWAAGTPTSIAISNGILTVTDGIAPNLETSTKTIPNVSAVQKTVVTDISEN